MPGRDPDLRRIHNALSKFPFSIFLAGSSLAYGLAVRARIAAYGLGILKQRSLCGFVLSVGNITVGGTGKTPAVITLARWAKNEGYSVCVLSRGYGGRYPGKVLEVSDGEGVKVQWEECGDEPYLLGMKLKGVPVVVCRKRYEGGKYAIEKFRSNFFILDDGFQHLALKRDFDLVLLDRSEPVGNGRLLPWGLLREPVGAIARADAIVFTRSNSTAMDTPMGGYLNHIPVAKFSAFHRPEAFNLPGVGLDHEPSFLAGKKVVAFAGIGRPEYFERTLKDLGVEVLEFISFPDHYVYGQEEIRRMEELRRTLGASYLVTTEKDWVRARRHITDPLRTGYLSIQFALGEEGEGLLSLIKEAADKKLSKA